MIYNGTIDLGPDIEAFSAFAHFGRLSPSDEYGYLHGAMHVALDGTENIKPQYLDKVSSQASQFIEEFGDELDDHEKWILQQLSECNKQVDNSNPNHDDKGRFTSKEVEDSVKEGRNPLPQLGPQLHSEKLNSMPNYFELKRIKYEPKVLDIKDLVSTQSWAKPESVDYLRAGPELRKPILVDKWKGKYIITQGNHRVITHLLKGHTKIKAIVRDLDKNNPITNAKFLSEKKVHVLELIDSAPSVEKPDTLNDKCDPRSVNDGTSLPQCNDYVPVPFANVDDSEETDNRLRQSVGQGEGEVKNVSLDTLCLTQSAVSRDKLKGMVKDYPQSMHVDTSDDSDELPIVLHDSEDDTNYVWDGHHRISVMRLMGDEETPARVYEMKRSK